MKTIEINGIKFQLVDIEKRSNFWSWDDDQYYYCPQIPPYCEAEYKRGAMEITDGEYTTYRDEFLDIFFETELFLLNLARANKDEYVLLNDEYQEIFRGTLEGCEKAIQEDRSSMSYDIDFADKY